MMPWDDEERIIAALEAKGRPIAANIVRAVGIARIEARSDATVEQGAAEGESRNSSKTCRENGNG